MQGKVEMEPGAGVTRSPNEFSFDEETALWCSSSARCESERQCIWPPAQARAAAGAAVCAVSV